MTRIIRFAQALNEALMEEMERDERVVVMGEDVGVYGGIFKVTAGLLEKFGPERVRDTPISENAIIGAALGAALVGLRPVAEIMHSDFFFNCMDQLANHVPKMRYMSGGKLKVPLVVRTQYSLGRYTGAQHSQFFPAFWMNLPGMHIVVPSTPYDAKGLLKASIRDDDPVIFWETARLYAVKGSVPEEEYIIPLGKADIKREGEDVTIIAIGRCVHVALEAAEKLEKEGISAEVVDPRTLNPLDKKNIINSVKKTGRVVMVSDDCKTAGVGAELAAMIMEEAFDYLDAPVARVAAPDVPAPFTPLLLDNYYMPKAEDVIKTVKSIIGRW